MERHAAWLFTLLASVASLFQLALVLGAPWGEFTLGGRWKGSLPTRARLIPLLSLLVLAAFSAVVLSRAGVMLPDLREISRRLSWVVVTYCAVGTIANSVTRSKRERQLWLPVAVAMLACGLIVATS